MWVLDAHCLEHPSVRSQDVFRPGLEDFPLTDIPPHFGKIRNVNVIEVVNTEEKSLVEKMTKNGIEGAIIGGLCDHFTLTNYTPLRSIRIVDFLGMVG